MKQAFIAYLTHHLVITMNMLKTIESHWLGRIWTLKLFNCFCTKAWAFQECGEFLWHVRESEDKVWPKKTKELKNECEI